MQVIKNMQVIKKPFLFAALLATFSLSHQVFGMDKEKEQMQSKNLNNPYSMDINSVDMNGTEQIPKVFEFLDPDKKDAELLKILTYLYEENTKTTVKFEVIRTIFDKTTKFISEINKKIEEENNICFTSFQLITNINVFLELLCRPFIENINNNAAALILAQIYTDPTNDTGKSLKSFQKFVCEGVFKRYEQKDLMKIKCLGASIAAQIEHLKGCMLTFQKLILSLEQQGDLHKKIYAILGDQLKEVIKFQKTKNREELLAAYIGNENIFELIEETINNLLKEENTKQKKTVSYGWRHPFTPCYCGYENKEKEKLVTKIKELKKQIEDLQAQIKSLKEKKQQDVERKKNEYDSKIDKLKDLLTTLTEQFNKAKQENKELTEQFNKAKQENKNRGTTIEKLQDELKKQKNKCEGGKQSEKQSK
jgi:hypothetical protein